MNSSIRFSFHVDFFSPFLRSQMKMEDLPLQRRCRMSDIQRVYTCWKDCRKNGKEMARSPTALYSVVLLPDCLLSFFPIFEKKAIIINSSSSIFFISRFLHSLCGTMRATIRVRWYIKRSERSMGLAKVNFSIYTPNTVCCVLSIAHRIQSKIDLSLVLWWGDLGKYLVEWWIFPFSVAKLPERLGSPMPRLRVWESNVVWSFFTTNRTSCRDTTKYRKKNGLDR